MKHGVRRFAEMAKLAVGDSGGLEEIKAGLAAALRDLHRDDENGLDIGYDESEMWLS